MKYKIVSDAGTLCEAGNVCAAWIKMLWFGFVVVHNSAVWIEKED